MIAKSDAISRASSKGQKSIRKTGRMATGLDAGSRFVVVGGSDVIILKKITPLSTSGHGGITADVRRVAELRSSSVLYISPEPVKRMFEFAATDHELPGPDGRGRDQR